MKIHENVTCGKHKLHQKSKFMLSPQEINQITQCYSRIKTTPQTKLSDTDMTLIEHVIAGLDQGKIRAIDANMNNLTYVREAIVCYLNQANYIHHNTHMPSYDKVPEKLLKNNAAPTFRALPHSMIRYGSFVADNCVIMPSFINIGAYIDSGSMIDTWATVGSCAQIGKNCHISGGTGIGGVLEPANAKCVIIEDNCFIGARSEVAEGVHVKQGAVIAAGTIITISTTIYDRTKKSFIPCGTIPENAVAVPTYMPSSDGTHSKYAVMIVKYADEATRRKTSIESLLRAAHES